MDDPEEEGDVLLMVQHREEEENVELDEEGIQVPLIDAQAIPVQPVAVSDEEINALTQVRLGKTRERVYLQCTIFFVALFCFLASIWIVWNHWHLTLLPIPFILLGPAVYFGYRCHKLRQHPFAVVTRPPLV